MSFILDALRKSENERQRGSVPDVARIPLAYPEPRMPRWTVTLIALLSAGVVVFAAAWWQAPRVGFDRPVAAVRESPRPSAPRASASSEPSGTVPAQATSASPAADPTVSVAPATNPPTAGPERRAAPAPVEREPVRVAATSTPARDDAPQPPPPSLAQLRASGVDIPALDLQLHSFSDSRSGRFVFINGTRYTEGETLAAGPRVVRITPNGVVLDQRGNEFLLTVD